MKYSKNTAIRSLALMAVLAMSFGCKEAEIKTYDGDNYMFFTYMNDRSAQTYEFNFATQAALEMTGQVPVSLSLWGFMLAQDVTYYLSVDPENTTAVANTDFVPVSQGVFHKENVVDTLWLEVKRNADLLATDFTIVLRLDAVDGCVVGPAEYKTATVRVRDVVEEPSWWSNATANRLGEYSDIKYRVFIIFMDGEILENLDAYTGIAFGQLITDFKAWWKEQWAEGNYQYYAVDGITPLYETISD